MEQRPSTRYLHNKSNTKKLGIDAIQTKEMSDILVILPLVAIANPQRTMKYMYSETYVFQLRTGQDNYQNLILWIGINC